MSYSKLHSSLVNSSLWTQPDNVRILFISLLSMCDQYGEIQGSRSGLERIANIRVPEGQLNPWEILLGPDPDSSDKMRNPGNDGRRIEEIPGGFKILNYEYYCMLRNEDDRREKNREAQARFRKNHDSITVIKSNHPSSSVIKSNGSKPTYTQTYTQTNTIDSSKELSCVALNLQIYNAYPRKVAKAEALRAISRALKRVSPALLLERTKAYAKSRKGEPARFTPHPASWFNGERYNDDPSEWIPAQEPKSKLRDVTFDK